MIILLWQQTKEGRKRLSLLHKGIPRSEETKKRISLALMGHKSWNKGLHTGIIPKTTFKKGGHPGREFKKGEHNGREFQKGHMPKEYLEKALQVRERLYLEGRLYRRPTNLEKKMLAILTKLNLPYKYVGDGKFWIAHKNPDFINVNGGKIALEVYVDYHKKCSFGSVEDWKRERNKLFNFYGWRIEYFNDRQVCEKEVSTRLKNTDDDTA